MTRKLSDSRYVNSQERMSLLPLKRLQNHISTILRKCLGHPHHCYCLSPLQAALQHKSFCVSQNPKHSSNETETIGLIDSVINPYLV